MCRRVFQFPYPVARAGHNVAVDGDHGTHGHFAPHTRGLRFQKGFLHDEAIQCFINQWSCGCVHRSVFLLQRRSARRPRFTVFFEQCR